MNKIRLFQCFVVPKGEQDPPDEALAFVTLDGGPDQIDKLLSADTQKLHRSQGILVTKLHASATSITKALDAVSIFSYFKILYQETCR